MLKSSNKMDFLLLSCYMWVKTSNLNTKKHLLYLFLVVGDDTSDKIRICVLQGVHQFIQLFSIELAHSPEHAWLPSPSSSEGTVASTRGNTVHYVGGWKQTRHNFRTKEPYMFTSSGMKFNLVFNLIDGCSPFFHLLHYVGGCKQSHT